MIEAVLLSIANEEQRDELSEFYLKYKDRLCLIANSKLNDHGEAEDAVLEAFSQIADKPDIFFNISLAGRLAYMSVIVRNISINIYNAKNKVHIEKLDDEMADPVSLEDHVLGKIAHDEILSFMNRLPETYKTVLILSYQCGLTIYEISERLNISISAVNKRLSSARKAIKEFVDERNKEL